MIPDIQGALRALALVCAAASIASTQVDVQRAEEFFARADALCERDGGKLWGVSLRGPMVFADAMTDTMALNRERPEEDKPRILGFANTALEWGDERWSTFVWPLVAGLEDAHCDRVMMHELFHRVQPDLGLLIQRLPGHCDHLDTLEGRVWLQLEWRALAAALGSEGEARATALSHAFAFRTTRRALGDDFAARERGVEINEGLAQYTGTLLANVTREAAVADAIAQLHAASDEQTFVRSFAYPTGAALGLLLDDAEPAWRTRVTSNDDLGDMLAAATGVGPAADADAAALVYDGVALRASEVMRERDRADRVAALRARFVDGPVLVMPRGRNASFLTAGVTPLGEEGTVYPSFRVTAPWGSIAADWILISPNGRRLTVPGPPEVDGENVRGDGWAITLAYGWRVAAGERDGDHMIAPSATDNDDG